MTQHATATNARVYDMLTKTESIPFPRGNDTAHANMGDIKAILSPKGWSVTLNGRSSWLFCDPYRRAARLWLLPDGVWRLSADHGFLHDATRMLLDLADAATRTHKNATPTSAHT